MKTREIIKSYIRELKKGVYETGQKIIEHLDDISVLQLQIKDLQEEQSDYQKELEVLEKELTETSPNI